jgi:hypothetical protein
VFEEAPGGWAARYEPDPEQEHNLLASYGGVLSLIPNAAALVQAMQVGGLREVRMLPAAETHNPQYRGGHRGIAVGYR